MLLLIAFVICVTSGVIMGGQVGERAPGRRPGSATAHFCNHLKTRFKQKFRTKYAKKCVFFRKKKCKNRLSVETSIPRLPPADGGSAHRLPRSFSRILLQPC